MKNFDRDIRKYKRHTKQLLTCPNKDRRQFTNDMERDLQRFLEENPSAGYSDVVAFFGSPEELAQTYLDGLPQEELIKFRYQRRYRTALLLTILCALFIVVSAFLHYQFNEYKVIYVEEKIDILDEGEE